MNDAEDVVQKTFCKLWDQHSSLNIRSSIDSYLYRIVHNDSINLIQQRILHEQHNLIYLQSINADTGTTSSELENQELQRAISCALAALPPKCRRVFEMNRFEQMPYSQIASELNISTNTVENHMSKALKLLRADLKDYISYILILQLLK
jgi:RNA polymerase sigma-70 factor (ECF subfamily)